MPRTNFVGLLIVWVVLPFEIKWKFKALLDQEGVTVYALTKKLAERMDQPLHSRTLYRWTSDAPGSPNFEGIGWVLWALEELTGKTFQISDILEYHRG